MSDEVLVGLVDSGVDAAVADGVLAAAAFALRPPGDVERTAAVADRVGHGSSIADTILSAAPGARIVTAQLFAGSLAAPPAVVAAALAWVIERGARIVNLSFGLRADREVLRAACAAAVRSGALLLAAAPARGPAVFPAAYPGVVRVSGDARCAAGEISALGSAQADFGACPQTRDGRVRGASAAVAHATGQVAAMLAADPTADAATLVRLLERDARYRGPERRPAAGTIPR